MNPSHITIILCLLAVQILTDQVTQLAAKVSSIKNEQNQNNEDHHEHGLSEEVKNDG